MILNKTYYQYLFHYKIFQKQNQNLLLSLLNKNTGARKYKEKVTDIIAKNYYTAIKLLNHPIFDILRQLTPK